MQTVSVDSFITHYIQTALQPLILTHVNGIPGIFDRKYLENTVMKTMIFFVFSWILLQAQMRDFCVSHFSAFICWASFHLLMMWIRAFCRQANRNAPWGCFCLVSVVPQFQRQLPQNPKVQTADKSYTPTHLCQVNTGLIHLHFCGCKVKSRAWKDTTL